MILIRAETVCQKSSTSGIIKLFHAPSRVRFDLILPISYCEDSDNPYEIQLRARINIFNMNSDSYDIRNFQDADLPSLASIYRRSIGEMGKEYYSQAQVDAWSSFPNDLKAFEKWITQATTLVAITPEHTGIGFGGIEDLGHICALFVSPEFARRGIGFLILEHLLKWARSREIFTVTADASGFSRPLFLKYGFEVIEIEQSEFKGVMFCRYAMQAHL